jgi:hypothetical protein
MSIEAIDLELSRGRRPASNRRYLLPICYQISSNYLQQWASGLSVQGQPKISISAKEQSGLGIHYDLREGHLLLVRRMPDLDLVRQHRKRAHMSQ